MKKAEFQDDCRDFPGLAQSSLKRRFVPNRQKAYFFLFGDAQRPASTAFLVHRLPSDPLWRHGADATILQPPQIAMAPAEVRPDSPPPRRLSSQRPHFGAPLFSDRWIAEDQSNRDPAIQWNISFAVGAGAISRSDHAAAVLAANAHTVDSTPGPPARSVAQRDIRAALGADHTHLRSGFGGADPLRTTAGSPYRLQSQEKGQTILSSLVVLRGASAGVLARVFAPGRRRFQHRSRCLSATLSGQGAGENRPGSNSRARRFGILQWQACPFPRSIGVGLCNCGTALPGVSPAGMCCEISKAQLGYGSGRVSIQAFAVEGSSSLCGDPASDQIGR